MKIVIGKKEIFIFIVFFCILMTFLIMFKILSSTNISKKLDVEKQNIFVNIDKKNFVNLTKYSIYGTNLNLEGNIEILKLSGINIDNVSLISKKNDNSEFEYPIRYNYSNNSLSFTTFDILNKSINLETLDENNYYIFLKVYFSNSDIKYYSLKNASEYKDLCYYSITKNNSNNKLNIEFNSFNNISYLGINVTKIQNLPDNIYDIAIDPGHGGLDNGDKKNEYTESELVLKCALCLKSKLEELGLKVYISRDGTESPNSDMANNMYDDNGRINKINESHAKLMISLHLNGASYSKNTGGIEVYSPSNCNIDFATDLAKQIVDSSSLYYSSLNSFKVEDGVYVRNFKATDITAYENKAKKNGYEPYKITTSTPYLYIIREIGGINTNAFVDGRNKSYGINKYYNSNYGIEGYKVYLGYMNIEQDLNNFLNNYESYANGIFNSIKSYFFSS